MSTYLHTIILTDSYMHELVDLLKLLSRFPLSEGELVMYRSHFRINITCDVTGEKLFRFFQFLVKYAFTYFPLFSFSLNTQRS